MFQSSERLMQPIVQYLDSCGIKIESEKRLSDAKGNAFSIDLAVVMPTRKASVLNVDMRLLRSRTPEQIKTYFETYDIAKQLEDVPTRVAIADLL